MAWREWLYTYAQRLATYVGCAWAIGFFTGQWGTIEIFFRKHPAVGAIAIIVDFSLYMIRKLEEREEVALGRRVRKTARKLRGGESDE